MWTVELNFVDGAQAKAIYVPFEFFQDALAYANLAAHILQTPGQRVKPGPSDRQDAAAHVLHPQHGRQASADGSQFGVGPRFPAAAPSAMPGP
jgi:hypothetical protein